MDVSNLVESAPAIISTKNGWYRYMGHHAIAYEVSVFVPFRQL